MEIKKNFPFRYAAGGCFAACALIYLIIRYGHIPSGDFYPYDLLCILAFAVIAVGLFVSVPMVSAAGSALLLVRHAIFLFTQIKYIFEFGDCYVWGFLSFLTQTIFALLLLITCLNRRSAKTTGVIAAAVRFFIPAIQIIINSGSLRSIALLLLECAGALCLGFAFSELKDKPKAVAATAPKASGVSDTYEKLTHLKELLDKELITQEDFDAKKKELLDS